MRLFGFTVPVIDVHLTPDAVTFIRGPRRESVAPVVYLERTPRSSGRAPRLLGVGSGVAVAASAERVEVFRPGSASGNGTHKGVFLDHLLRHGFVRMQPGWIKWKPHVRFHGSAELSAVFGGYERAVLLWAAEQAGAAEATFVS